MVNGGPGQWSQWVGVVAVDYALMRYNRDEYQWARSILTDQQNIRQHLPVRKQAPLLKKPSRKLGWVNLVMVLVVFACITYNGVSG